MKNKLSQVTKKASEVPADPGTGTVVSNTAVKEPALKGRRFQKVGGPLEAKARSLPSQFSLGRDFNLTGPPSLEKSSPQQHLQSAMALQHSSKNVIIYNNFFIQKN